MRQTVNGFIKKHSLLFDGATVVVGVSGGPDSLALLSFLNESKRKMQLNLIAAHVDHMLRGDESLEDLYFVESFCKEHDIVFEGKQIDVNTYQQNHKVSLQVAARECRYQFFKEVITKHKADLLALGHHGDDQIETMLMRQVRGAYGEGLAGIPVKRVFHNSVIIRPFLTITKEEILNYCAEKGLTPRIDQSNFTSKYTRNRFRNDLLPILKKENPNIHLRFQKQSELLLEDQQYLGEIAANKIEEAIISKTETEIVISISRFNRSAIPLQRRGFQLILNYLYGQKYPEISTIHIDEFIALMKNFHPSGYLDLPNGLKIIKAYDKCIVTFHTIEMEPDYECQFPIPGIVKFKKGKIVSELLQSSPSVRLDENKIVCDLEKLMTPLVVRNRKQGDRISLVGMEGKKKLKNLFIDSKISRKERNDWPILVDNSGEILWVPRLKRSTIAYPTEETKHFVLFTYIEG